MSGVARPLPHRHEERGEIVHEVVEVRLERDLERGLGPGAVGAQGVEIAELKVSFRIPGPNVEQRPVQALGVLEIAVQRMGTGEQPERPKVRRILEEHFPEFLDGEVQVA